MLQADSLGCRLRWSVGMCVRGALGVNTVESGEMKWDRAEEHWPDGLADHTGVWSDEGSPGLS